MLSGWKIAGCPASLAAHFSASASLLSSLHSVIATGRRYLPSAWNGSWNVAPENPSATSAIRAITRVIGAGRALVASGRATCKRQVSGSNPLTGSQFSEGKYPPASADHLMGGHTWSSARRSANSKGLAGAAACGRAGARGERHAAWPPRGTCRGSAMLPRHRHPVRVE